MAYERYTLREKWEGITGTSQTKWLSVRHTPYFKSEEEAEEYYDRNRDFINASSNGREVAVFRIVHDEIMVKELWYNNSMLSKENRFSKGVLPADTKEKVLEVEDGIVTKKEVDGTVYLRKKCARFGTMFWEAEGTPFYTSISSETYWCS